MISYKNTQNWKNKLTGNGRVSEMPQLTAALYSYNKSNLASML